MSALLDLPFGFSQTPPASPWGINFGGGLNSTAVIVECRNRGWVPDWILFADTGSELPGTIEHVAKVAAWTADWCEVTTVRWERVKGEIKGFEPLHEHCLRTGYLPSKAYGYAGCTSKWKIQPMDRWRKAHGFDQGAFAVGYDAGEHRRIKTACERGDEPGFSAWYPLVAWGIDRPGCQTICEKEGFTVGKSSCFMCPNMRKTEWLELKAIHPKYFALAVEIEQNAFDHGNPGPRNGLYKGGLLAMAESAEEPDLLTGLEDRCHHGGCFT
jgi:hypothetical protein